MPLVKFNIEDIKVAVREYLNGKKSLNEVGESHSMTGGNLRHWVIKLGYKPRKNHESRFDEIRIKECCDLYIQGGRTKELAKKYNVDRRTIMDWLIRSEIKPKKFNETLGVTLNMKDLAREMYIKEELNCIEISKILGVSGRAILDWVKDVKRSRSEIAAIKIIKNGSPVSHRGVHGKINTSFGIIHHDSSYERDRIIQLTQDENISFFGRCKDRIKYKIEDDIIKGYIPDFYIEYKDGRKIVEEVKPFVFIKKFNNLIKFKSAKEFYKNKNIIFRVTTESAIYVGGFKGNKKLILTN